MAQIQVIHSEADLRQAVGMARRSGKRIGFVPTMGGLHEGHLSLMREARKKTDFVVISVYVNPTQFGPNEDFDAYPRDLEADRALAESVGVDVIFAPAHEVMYPEGFATCVVQERLTEKLCGRSRPHHFHGVCTIVAKLLNLVQPDVAYFGQKDYQQSVVIRRMVTDLNMPVVIRMLPIIREPDGLAMSSRNQYLTPTQRRQALCLYRALQAGERSVAQGEEHAAALIAQMKQEIATAPDARIDYVEVIHPETLDPLETVDGPAVAAAAVWIGATRLIDNVILAPRE